MANVTTVRGRSNLSTNRELLDFAEGISLLDPNENPFTLMSMKFKTKTSGNVKHSWLRDELVPESDTVDTTTACVTAGTTLYVDNGDRWAIGDIFMREATHETCLITARTSDALTIVRDYGATSGAYTALADEFDDEDVITWIGNAFEDAFALPALKSTTETQIDNWCQLQRTPWAMGELAQAAAMRGEDDWVFQDRKAAITHLRKLERQHIFGHPMPGDAGIYATTNDNPATAGGLLHYLTGGTSFDGTGSDRLVSNASITHQEFLDYLEAIFEYGSSRRVAFVAPLFRSALDYWGISKLNTFSETTKYGMKIATWLSSHGEISFITHKMLKDAGGDDGAYAFFVDMDDISQVIYQSFPTQKRTLDPYAADGTMAKKAEWLTCSSLEVREPKKHGCIYGTTSYAS